MFPIADFRALLSRLEQELQTENGLWTLRGFVDTARRIYSLGGDTKVISKAIELMLLPPIIRFWEAQGFRVILAEFQNSYPDVSLVREDERYAIDLKTAYRLSSAPPEAAERISGFTLGAFTGYFRNRESTKNVTFPYGTYRQHYVVGVVYSQVAGTTSAVYALDDLDRIVPPIRDLAILVQEKWRIASARPGSGNTRNIGSITDMEALRRGLGPFAQLGDEGEVIFSEYWQHYLTHDMARAVDRPLPPFHNLREYLAYRNRPDLLARLEGRDETTGV